MCLLGATAIEDKLQEVKLSSFFKLISVRVALNYYLLNTSICLSYKRKSSLKVKEGYVGILQMWEMTAFQSNMGLAGLADLPNLLVERTCTCGVLYMYLCSIVRVAGAPHVERWTCENQWSQILVH